MSLKLFHETSLSGRITSLQSGVRYISEKFEIQLKFQTLRNFQSLSSLGESLQLIPTLVWQVALKGITTVCTRRNVVLVHRNLDSPTSSYDLLPSLSTLFNVAFLWLLSFFSLLLSTLIFKLNSLCFSIYSSLPLACLCDQDWFTKESKRYSFYLGAPSPLIWSISSRKCSREMIRQENSTSLGS